MTNAITQTWSWPIDIALYDDNPLLSELEQLELNRILNQRIDAKKASDEIPGKQILKRLLQPLEDALTITGISHHRCYVIRLFLLEMQQRQRSFWAWTEAEWLETIGHNRKAFYVRHPTTGRDIRQYVMALGYLLRRFKSIICVKDYYRYAFAIKIFGQEALQTAIQPIEATLNHLGYESTLKLRNGHNILSEALLLNQNPFIEALTDEILQEVRQHNTTAQAARGLVALSRALHAMGILIQPLPTAKMGPVPRNQQLPTSGVAPEWAAWCERWYRHALNQERTRKNTHLLLIKVGRWLMTTHPEVISPAQWTREIAADYVAMVLTLRAGNYVHPDTHSIPKSKLGKPLAHNSKVAYISAARIFLRDCQEWDWIPKRFNPVRALPIPPYLLSQR